MRFRAELELNGKTATGITVPAEVIDALGAGKRPRVTVTLNGHTFDITLGSMGGVPTIPVSAAVRTAAGVEAGEILEVDLAVATAPAAVTVPDDLRAELRSDSNASGFFDRLTVSQQRGYTDWIEQAKKPDTRARRVEQTMAALREHKKRR